MKKRINCSPIYLVSLLALLILLAFVFLTFHGFTDITGCWETVVNIVNSPDESTTQSTSNRIHFYFFDDLTGKEIQWVNGIPSERVFSYTIDKDELCIIHESGEEWRFPFKLEKDTLILTQHGFPVTYSKVTEEKTTP